MTADEEAVRRRWLEGAARWLSSSRRRAEGVLACGRGGEVVVAGQRRPRSRVRGAGERELAGQREEPAWAGGGGEEEAGDGVGL